ncbi:hypothetical protein RQM59_07440 [Flavobacteriaceae bacterium S356]|uniref:tRNA (Guanine-N1)-methyltransferase n=1 Tax=Asprobacillus argus TaxID=3076534 RepID=A0ABU3LG96_9FLAO|nr:hypothetical protein [Flavobacteriaceae bacterium S356]
MKSKSTLTLFVTLLIAGVSFSQTQKDTLTINEQFDKIYRISTSYQEYKVIKKTRYQRLKNKVQDSISTLKNSVATKNRVIISQNDSLTASRKKVTDLSNNLATIQTEKDSISLLGITMSKSGYSILVWGIIAVLLASLLFFVYKFKSSNVDTVEAKNNLTEIEEEFAVHKKKSLEKEQKLRRQLQDEINKQRGV